MAKKYQVFISSTFDDLKEHRDAVVKAVLQLGHLPVGMEMFNAGDQTQWETIKSYIDSSDYYLVVLAHRYGTKDPESGLSYTETEYDYAGEQGIPRLGFVIEKGATWPADMVEAKAKKKLDAFKSKVGKARVIKFWNTIDKLAYHVSLSLSNEITINPRTGWVRATEAASPQVAEELARLSKENKEYANKLSFFQGQDELAFLIDIISNEFSSIPVGVIEAHVSYLELFMIACSNQENPHTLKLYHIVLAKLDAIINDDFQWIKHGFEELARLSLLSVTRSPNGSDNSYWTLTEKGRSLYIKLRYPQLNG